MALFRALLVHLLRWADAQDCSGHGVTWGPGIGPPPDGCAGPAPPGPTTQAPSGGGGTSGSCSNPSCSSPPCAAPLLGDVGCTTVAGQVSYDHEMLKAGDTIALNAHIYGPFEAGFGAQQENIIKNWGCSDASVVYDNEGGTDVGTAEARVAYLCNIQFPRLSGGVYYGVVGQCGGHTHDYHFHRSFSCLYSLSGGHSSKVGVVASYSMYGKWEDYAQQRLPLLDACGAHIGPTPESSTPVYHYHVQDGPPFTVACYGPSSSGGLVSVALCRSLHSQCDDDGGSGTTFTLKDKSVTYDRFCPCFDAAGSNMGSSIQELPALSSGEIYYSASHSGDTTTTVPSSQSTTLATQPMTETTTETAPETTEAETTEAQTTAETTAALTSSPGTTTTAASGSTAADSTTASASSGTSASTTAGATTAAATATPAATTRSVINVSLASAAVRSWSAGLVGLAVVTSAVF
ncbi:unnamed protein product [Effrenium voratum]|nr:unnamed protein product [Effrenium voratum]